MVLELVIVELDKSWCKCVLLVTFFSSNNEGTESVKVSPSTSFAVGNLFLGSEELGLGTWIEACTFPLFEDKKGNEAERNVEVCMEAMKMK